MQMHSPKQIWVLNTKKHKNNKFIENILPFNIKTFYDYNNCKHPEKKLTTNIWLVMYKRDFIIEK